MARSCVKDVSSNLINLKDLKESNTVELDSFYVSTRMAYDPVFGC